MRRLLLALLVFLTAAAANAAGSFYLSQDGTLWQATATPQGLVLTATLDGRTVASTTVPYEIGLAGSFDNNVQVVADEVTGQVAVVWQRNWSDTASEILLAVWSGGQWQSVIHLGSGLASVPRNPNATLTVSSTTVTNPTSGQSATIRDAYVHVLWWEGAGTAQQGMYALLDLSGSLPQSQALQVIPLDSLLPVGIACNGTIPPEVLEHPLFASQITPGRAMAFFGSQETCLFQLVQVSFQLQPAQAEAASSASSNRRRHVPVFGFMKVFDAPTAMGLENARVLLSSDLNPVAYRINGSALEYVVGNPTGGWSSLHVLPATNGLSLDQAIPLVENLAR